MTSLISIALLLLAIIRTPLFVVIAASAMLGFYAQEVDLSVIAIEIYRLAEMPVLLAIPLFTFAGYLLGESQASRRLVNLTHALLGWLPGGLAIVAIVAYGCATGTSAVAASTHPFSVHDMLAMQRVGDPQAVPFSRQQVRQPLDDECGPDVAPCQSRGGGGPGQR